MPLRTHNVSYVDTDNEDKLIYFPIIVKLNVRTFITPNKAY